MSGVSGTGEGNDGCPKMGFVEVDEVCDAKDRLDRGKSVVGPDVDAGGARLFPRSWARGSNNRTVGGRRMRRPPKENAAS